MPSPKSLAGVLEALRLTPVQVEELTSHPERHWRLKEITVGGKRRPIRLPSKLLAIAQNRLLKGPLQGVPIHPASYCEKGRGGLLAARMHAGHPELLHLDIKGFFPSVSTVRVTEELQRVRFEQRAASLIAALTTTADQLPQGAATSVALGNLVLGKLDGRIHVLATKRGLTYTRYVDDIGISGGRRVAAVERLVRDIVANEGWSLGVDKGGRLGIDMRHSYLGVIVNFEPNLTDDYVKNLRFVLKAIGLSPAPPSEALLRRVWGRLEWVSQVRPDRGKTLKALAVHYKVPRPARGPNS